MSDAKDLDAATSQACTRAGAFALLISLALASLTPSWTRQQNLLALGEYLSLRAELNITLEQLDQNPYWKTHLGKSPDAESQPLKQLLDVTIEMEGAGQTVEVHPRIGSAATSAVDSVPRPEPPKNMRLMTNIVEISDIVEILKSVNDSTLLTRSRNASSLANYSVYRWALKRNSLILENQTTTPWLEERFSPSAMKRGQQLAAGYVPSVKSDDLISYLTLTNVRQLANFAPPIIDEGVRVADVREAPIEVSPGALPKNLYWATVSAQLLLGFVMAYFGLFLREATRSPAFPAPGTLFGAFWGSRGAQLVFGAAVVAPALASGTVAIVSREWAVILTSGLVFAAVAYVLIAARGAGLLLRVPPQSRIDVPDRTG